MKFCSKISKANLLTQATSLVSSAKEEIFATMDLDEEVINPLPKAYHLLLLRKKKAGVIIVRYGYGSKRAYQEIVKFHSEMDLVYRGNMEGYQRMLITDRKKGMFSVDNKYFYTEFVPLIYALMSFTQVDRS